MLNKDNYTRKNKNMVSTGFGYGERESISEAYARMYAPKHLMNESCCCDKDGCECGGKTKVGKKKAGNLPTRHKIPAKTGSKLGVRKVLPFEKRDKKPSAKKFTPKMKKITESNRFYCISDGDRVLCTNDIGESYFNKGGICGETRIYESKVSALKDISKVKARRNPNSKYKVRACECVGESTNWQFVDSYQTHPVNEGLWDMVSGIGKGAMGAVGNGLSAVGNLGKAAGNALQGNFSQAGEHLKGAGNDALGMISDDLNTENVGQAASNAAETAKNGASSAWQSIKNAANGAWDATKKGAGAVGGVAQGVGQVAGGALNAAGSALQGDLSQAGKDIVDGGAGAVNAVKSGFGSGQQNAGAQGQQQQGQQNAGAQGQQQQGKQTPSPSGGETPKVQTDSDNGQKPATAGETGGNNGQNPPPAANPPAQSPAQNQQKKQALLAIIAQKEKELQDLKAQAQSNS